MLEHKIQNYKIILLCLIAVFVLGACATTIEPGPDDVRPNILLIVADDLAYADLGSYGSDIATLNIDALAAKGILFTQFHTAAAEDFYNQEPFKGYVQEHYDNAYGNMGRASSFVSYGPQWAEAGSAPFQRHKGYTREGGITAPMIISGPGVAPHAKKTSAYLTVMDLAPTFLELAGAEYPAGGMVQPMLGESINAFLAGPSNAVHDENYLTVLSHKGRALVRQGKWKLSTLEPPFDEAQFGLFDLEADPGETNNLTESEPEKYQEHNLL